MSHPCPSLAHWMSGTITLHVAPAKAWLARPGAPGTGQRRLEGERGGQKGEPGRRHPSDRSWHHGTHHRCLALSHPFRLANSVSPSQTHQSHHATDVLVPVAHRHQPQGSSTTDLYDWGNAVSDSHSTRLVGRRATLQQHTAVDATVARGHIPTHST